MVEHKRIIQLKDLKNSFCRDEKNDAISYVSAIANMEGGFLVMGIHDKTLEIVSTDTTESICLRK